MKALILHLKEVPYTIESALIAAESCKTFDVEPQLFEGYVPSKANEYIKQKGLGFYDPGPKLYRIKNKKGGVRGCMISHLEMWHEVVRRNETTIIMEHDAQMVRNTWRADFDDILHCDAHRFEEDADAGTDSKYDDEGIGAASVSSDTGAPARSAAGAGACRRRGAPSHRSSG